MRVRLFYWSTFQTFHVTSFEHYHFVRSSFHEQAAMASRAQPAPVRRYFEIRGEDSENICIIGACKHAAVKTKQGSTTNLIRHVKDHHPKEYEILPTEMESRKRNKSSSDCDAKEQRKPTKQTKLTADSFIGRRKYSSGSPKAVELDKLLG